MESLLNVTVDSLATLVGVIDGQDDYPDTIRSQRLKMQLGILQSKSRPEQMSIHCEFAAKYLPALVEKYKQSTGVLNSAMTLLNVITYTPYFVRFAKTTAGQGIAALQTKRTAEAAADIGNMNADLVGEILQFLSTLLVLQGIAGVDDEDKKILLPKLKQWERGFRGRLAAETSGRCLALLANDLNMRPMMKSVKTMLESKLQQCGAPGCPRRAEKGGSDLMQCARCKTAVYCGADHQKQAWPSHKAVCFSPAF